MGRAWYLSFKDRTNIVASVTLIALLKTYYKTYEHLCRECPRNIQENGNGFIAAMFCLLSKRRNAIEKREHV